MKSCVCGNGVQEYPIFPLPVLLRQVDFYLFHLTFPIQFGLGRIRAFYFFTTFVPSFTGPYNSMPCRDYFLSISLSNSLFFCLATMLPLVVIRGKRSPVPRFLCSMLHFISVQPTYHLPPPYLDCFSNDKCFATTTTANVEQQQQ